MKDNPFLKVLMMIRSHLVVKNQVMITMMSEKRLTLMLRS
ncbi:Uncharacterised protein [Vibrio cholerae]|nr:Uncharacterised protein [Vibrio cholerae]